MQYHFADFVLDTGHFALYRGGARVNVQPQVLRLLRYLIEQRDRAVSRMELLDLVYGSRVVTDNALTASIRAARLAVGDTASSQTCIRTVHGRGYRFVAKVEARPGVVRPPTAASAAPVSSTVQPAIAVLPFDTIGGGDQGAVIAKGLVHDVTTRIARSRAMLVIARSSAFQFQSGAEDVAAVGTRLGVRYVVQGAAQLSNGKIRVSVGLANTETGEEVAAWQYDTRLDDVLVIQDEIAMLIVSAVETEIQKQEMRLSTLMPSSNLDAWRLYHRGLSHMYQFRMKECDAAEVCFRRAIDLEPNVPRPYAGLSFVNFERAYLNLDNSRPGSLRRAFEYAEQALAVDAMDPMAHWALSRAQLLDGELDSARKSIAVATELNPSYAAGHYLYGWICMQLGDHRECVDRVDIARKLSPFDPLIYGMMCVSGMSLALLGEREDAISRIREALAHPNMHFQACATSAAALAIAGEAALARDVLRRRVLAADPNYDADEFFSVYAYRNVDDVRRINAAFEQIRRTL